MDSVAPTRLSPVLAQERASHRVAQPHVMLVPLGGWTALLVPEPARGRRIIGAGDLDAAVEMHGAGAVLVVAKRFERQRPETRLLLGEHGGDLALGGA
jgi:hypothetical protein